MHTGPLTVKSRYSKVHVDINCTSDVKKKKKRWDENPGDDLSNNDKENQRSNTMKWMFVWFADCSISSRCSICRVGRNSLSIDDVDEDDDDDGVGVVFGCSRCRRSQSSVRSVCGCYYDFLVERQSEKKRERERARERGRKERKEMLERWKKKVWLSHKKVLEKERVRWAFSPSYGLQFIDESINILTSFSFCHSVHSLPSSARREKERARIVTRKRTNNTTFSSPRRSSHYF